MRGVVEKFYQSIPENSLEPERLRFQINGLIPFFEKNTGGTFLDIGCHNGDKTLCLGEFIGADQIVGMDFKSPALRRAKERGILSVAIDLNQLGSFPFPSRMFDCIHIGEVIEHIFSPDMLLAEVARLLKPGGYSVITTPNLSSWRNRLVLLFGWQPFETEVSTQVRVGNPMAPRGPLPGHIRVFVSRSLIELCNYYGLKVIKLGGRLPNLPTTSLAKMLQPIDWMLSKLFPSLCEGTIIKVGIQ